MPKPSGLWCVIQVVRILWQRERSRRRHGPEDPPSSAAMANGNGRRPIGEPVRGPNGARSGRATRGNLLDPRTGGSAPSYGHGGGAGGSDRVHRRGAGEYDREGVAVSRTTRAVDGHPRGSSDQMGRGGGFWGWGRLMSDLLIDKSGTTSSSPAWVWSTTSYKETLIRRVLTRST